MSAQFVLPARSEIVVRTESNKLQALAEGVELSVFASAEKGVRRLTTGLARFEAGAELPPHAHSCGEAMVVVDGRVLATVEDRQYLLNRYDALFIPADIAHAVRNASAESPATVHVSFPSGSPDRKHAALSQDPEIREQPPTDAAESLRRYELAEPYELAGNTEFRDLFASRYGSEGVCGGVGVFKPGSELPCHTHRYDESITIIRGQAVCSVAGRRYELENCDTACVPEGSPHRFLNESNEVMAMIWVYAGDEPDRDVVDVAWCQFGAPSADS